MQLVYLYLLFEAAHEESLIGFGVKNGVRDPLADKVDFSDDMAIVKVIHNDCCIQDRAVHLLMCLGQQPTGSLAFLHNYNNI